MKKITILAVLIFGVFFLLDRGAQAGLLDFFYTTKDKLAIEGNRVFFNGGPIVLSGVAVGDPYFRQTTYRRTAEDYKTISEEWQANTVRLSIHPSFVKDEKRVKKILEEEIESARKNNLLVILDYHVIGFPNSWFKPLDQPESFSYDSNFKTAMDFWKYAAVKYRDDPGVIFELWNEPADKKERKWADLKPYMERLYSLIRSQGANNIIISPGVYWSYDLRGTKGSPLSGKNIGYAWHNYPFSGKYLSWSTALDNLNEKYPVFVTEWGFSADPSKRHFATLDAYGQPLKKLLKDKKLNFTAWCWHTPWDPRMFENNWTDLTPYGKFVKNFLSEIKAEEKFAERVNDFITRGSDENSSRLGEGERRGAVNSFEAAFLRSPVSEEDLSDLLRIANGLAPAQKSEQAENRAKNNFKLIYGRSPVMTNKNDALSIKIMAYGLRQKAGSRNLGYESSGVTTFKKIFRTLPKTCEHWNIVQAIAYSGAR